MDIPREEGRPQEECGPQYQKPLRSRKKWRFWKWEDLGMWRVLYANLRGPVGLLKVWDEAVG